MIKNLITLIFGLLIYSCSTSKIKYFDESNTEISKTKYYEELNIKKLLSINGDSTHHKKLAIREKRGEVNDMHLFRMFLEKELNISIDPKKPIVIIYHPGKDPCNSSASSSKTWIKNWHTQLENGLIDMAEIKPIYIYKDESGLKKYEGILQWKKDPEGITERLFFEHHYPCSSFVVISKNGNYLSYFGEFAIETVWAATQIMNE